MLPIFRERHGCSEFWGKSPGIDESRGMSVTNEERCNYRVDLIHEAVGQN
jgi:hypothetical protein